MAVESPHVNLFPTQIQSNRKMIDEVQKNVYESEMKFGYGMLPMYTSDTIPATDSGITISRKRSRETSSFDPSFQNAQFVNQNQFNNQKRMFTFLGQDISMQIYQQQLETDRFIAHHTENVRSEIEANRRRNSMRLIVAAEEVMKKKLRSKEDEINKIVKLNYALEEKVKSLNIENQIWQQMAQSNEATANVLRNNLQQILTQIQTDYTDKTTVDDVESCCGSNYDIEYHRRTLEKQDKRTLADDGVGNDVNAYCTASRDSRYRLNRWCRNCGKEESCVLLLPCRHLCICTVCESSINVCPICKFAKNASLHVNLS